MSLVSTGRSGFNILGLNSGGGGGMPGSTYDYSSAYGGKPVVPDPTATAGQAISGNLANMPGIGNLASSIDQSNTQNLSTALEAMFPDYANLTNSRSNLIESNLEGNLGKDWLEQMQQHIQEYGAGSGTINSPSNMAAFMRAVGLGTYQVQQTALDNLSKAVTTTPLPKMFDPSSMLVSPEQQQSAAMAANMYASAPDPYAAAMAAMSAGQIPQAPQKGTNYPTINPGPQTRPGSKASGVPNIEGGSQAADPTTMGEQTTNTPWNNLFSNWQAAYGGGSTNTGQIPSTDGTGTTNPDYASQLFGLTTDQTGQVPDYASQAFGLPEIPDFSSMTNW